MRGTATNFFVCSTAATPGKHRLGRESSDEAPRFRFRLRRREWCGHHRDKGGHGRAERGGGAGAMLNSAPSGDARRADRNCRISAAIRRAATAGARGHRRSKAESRPAAKIDLDDFQSGSNDTLGHGAGDTLSSTRQRVESATAPAGTANPRYRYCRR